MAGFNNTNIVSGNVGSGLLASSTTDRGGKQPDSANGYISCKVVNTYFGLDVSGTVGIPNLGGGLDLRASGNFIGSIVGGAQSRSSRLRHSLEALSAAAAHLASSTRTGRATRSLAQATAWNASSGACKNSARIEPNLSSCSNQEGTIAGDMSTYA